MASTFLEDYFDHSANLSQSSASFRSAGRHHRRLRPQECLRLCFHVFFFAESQMASGDSNCEAKTMFGPRLPLGPNMNTHRCMCKVYCTKKIKNKKRGLWRWMQTLPSCTGNVICSQYRCSNRQQSRSIEVQSIYPQTQSWAELSCQSWCFTLFL